MMFLRLFKIKNLLSNSRQRDTLIFHLTSIIWEPHFRVALDTLETWLTFQLTPGGHPVIPGWLTKSRKFTLVSLQRHRRREEYF